MSADAEALSAQYVVHEIKRFDTARYVEDILSINGAPIDLTGATVVLVMENMKTGTVTRRAALVHDAAGGTVRYQFILQDVSYVAKYLAEWEITFPDASVMTVPENSNVVFSVVEDLG